MSVYYSQSEIDRNELLFSRSAIGSPTAQRTTFGAVPEVEHTAYSNIRRKDNPVVSVYRSLGWMMGFRSNYGLLCFFVFGGALLGFCLGRSTLLNPKLIEANTVAGEFFWFRMKTWKANYYIHIYLTEIGGILVGVQFLPGLRKTAVVLHRLNGYLCLLLLIVGNICGSILAYRSFGGEINSQTAYYLLGLMIVFSGLAGLRNVKKDTREHRKWMLRMVTYFCTIITARLMMLAGREIVSRIGNYYTPWRCDQLIFTAPDPTSLQSQFPQCFNPNVDPSSVYVAVRANVRAGVVGLVSAVRVVNGMTLWLAMLIHVIGVEIYIQKTAKSNHTRYGYVLEPEDFDAGDQLPWDYK